MPSDSRLSRTRHTLVFVAAADVLFGVYLWLFREGVLYGQTPAPPALIDLLWAFMVGGVFALTWWISVRILPSRWAPLVLLYWVIYPYLTFAVSIVGLIWVIWALSAFPIETLGGSALAALLHYAYLRTRPPTEFGGDLCRECGYSLVGLQRGVCPECGKPV